MPTLNWNGKQAVVKHHKDVPFRLLEPVSELSCGDADSGNLIVQGDNLHALKALLPRYAGQVKCIYIDPPYNTGNEGWVYNDNVNSPDFVIRMLNGLTLVVEYKGGHIADGRDSKEKKQIGALWAKRSDGTYRFVWVENEQWHLIVEAASISNNK